MISVDGVLRCMVQWSIVLMLCFESASICACQVSSSHLRSRVELQLGGKFPLHVVVDVA